jgi:hypothetical protein
VPEPSSEYMTGRQASELAEQLSQFGGKNSLTTRLATMETLCRKASRLIKAMRRQSQDSDVFGLPPEE